MSKAQELRIISRSRSADTPIQYHHRTGDSEGNGAPVLDLYASTQSAEADIIDEEDRAEQRKAKKQFARLLSFYFKKILAPEEYRFFTACLKEKDKTPYAVGRALGIDYKQAFESIAAKNAANVNKLVMLMRYSGYNSRHGLEFLPRLKKYVTKAMRTRAWLARYRAEHREEYNASQREWRETHREEYNTWCKAWRQKNIEICRARCRKYYATHREEHRTYQRKWAEEHREEINERARINHQRRRATATPEQLEKRRAQQRAAARRQREKNGEKLRERNRRWYEQNRERQSAYNKNYRRTRPDEMRIAENERKRQRRAEHREEYNARQRERYRQRKTGEPIGN